MTEEELSYQIRSAIYEVYFELGPGLLESCYEFALIKELELRGLSVEPQVQLPLLYKGFINQNAFRLDILVEGKIIIEIKSVEELSKVHHKQVLTYLKLTGLHLGILVNFNTDYIKGSIFRKVNGYSLPH